MAAVPLRIVCIFAAVFCGGGARAAPTVAYDQRQHGEFNLRVDLDDVAIVLLPGGDGAADLFPVRRDGQAGGKVHGTPVLQLLQLAGRRNGVARPKKRKKPVECTGTAKPLKETTAGTDQPPQSPSNSSTPQPVVLISSEYETPQQPSSDRDGSLPPAPVSESEVVAAAAADDNDPSSHSGPDEYLIDDPYSVTPNTPDIFERFSSSVKSNATVDMVAVKTLENNTPVPAHVPEFLENAVVVKTPVPSRVPQETDAVAPPVTTKFEENPISVSSDAKTVVEKSDGTTVATALRDEVDVKATVPYEPPQVTREPAVADSTVVVKTNESTTGNSEKSDTAVAANDQAVEKKPEGPVELVAVKTLEKPTFAEALKAAVNGAVDGGGKKPITAENSLTSDPVPVDVQLRTNEKNAETVVVKTAEKPTVFVEVTTEVVKKLAAFTESSNEVAKKPVDVGIAGESGITTDTKPVELLKDKSSAAEAAFVVSRVASKPTTEMVAVKTIENSATVATVNTVTAVKTVMKSGNAKTTLNVSNGSTIVRKVADRRPLPSMTFEVATPKVARA